MHTLVFALASARDYTTSEEEPPRSLGRVRSGVPFEENPLRLGPPFINAACRYTILQVAGRLRNFGLRNPDPESPPGTNKYDSLEDQK